MNTFGDDLVQSLHEAINLTQPQIAPLVGMSLSGYRQWEQGARRVSGPAAASFLLHIAPQSKSGYVRSWDGEGLKGWNCPRNRLELIWIPVAQCLRRRLLRQLWKLCGEIHNSVYNHSHA